MNINLTDDMIALTNMDHASFDKLNKRYQQCISSAVAEAKVNGEGIVEVDFGFGQLVIKCDDPKDIKFKLIPNDSFLDILKKSAETGVNQLNMKVNDSLSKKFMNIYKDLLE